MRTKVAHVMFLVSLLLAGCASAVGAQPQPLSPAATDRAPTGTSALPSPATGTPALGVGDLTRVDDQGNVVVEVRPTDLSRVSEVVEFVVSMNTHSVDLNMDLAALSSLTTDTGKRALAASWDGTPGGHHVGGKLVFVVMQDGKSILDGATTLTLTMTDIYAPSRIFEWQLQ